MTVHSMFSVPIIHYRVENWEVNKKRIMDALPGISQGMYDDNGQMYTDFFNEQHQKDLPPYSDVVLELISPMLHDFASGSRVEITDMWFQTSHQGMSHGIHNHGATGWSSVIYVDFDKEKHDPTVFYSPFDNFWNGSIQSYVPPVEEGDMIIFPACIKHEAVPNKTDTPRTIISYNLRGKVDYVKKTLWADGGPPKIVERVYREDC